VPAHLLDQDEDFEVLEACWDAAMVFVRLDTQWVQRTDYIVAQGMIPVPIPIQSYRGLDYAGVDTVIARSGCADPDTVFAQIQLMERAALPVKNQPR